MSEMRSLALFSDWRHAARSLTRNRTFAAIAIVAGVIAMVAALTK